MALFVAWGACPHPGWAQTVRTRPVDDPFERFRNEDPPPAPLLPLEVAWTLTLPVPPSAPATMDGERVYVPLRDERLVAIDREYGTLAWQRDISTAFPPVVGDDGTLFVLHGTALRALDAASGGDRWTVDLEASPATGLTAAAGRLLVPLVSGELRSIHAATGGAAWQQMLPARAAYPPVVRDARVFITLTDSRLLAISLTDGALLWEQAVAGMLSPPAAAADRVYVGSTDNALYAFDAESGRRRWRMPGGGDVIGAAVDGGMVYYVSLDNIVRALNQGNGNQRWRKESGTRPQFPPLAFGGVVIVPGVAPAAVVFDARTGARLGEMTLTQGSLIGPPLVDATLPAYRTTVVMLSREGVLEAFRSVPLLFREAAPAPATALPGRVTPREPLPANSSRSTAAAP